MRHLGAVKAGALQAFIELVVGFFLGGYEHSGPV